MAEPNTIQKFKRRRIVAKMRQKSERVRGFGGKIIAPGCMEPSHDGCTTSQQPSSTLEAPFKANLGEAA